MNVCQWQKNDKNRNMKRKWVVPALPDSNHSHHPFYFALPPCGGRSDLFPATPLHALRRKI
jgi:hypothetical protein